MMSDDEYTIMTAINLFHDQIQQKIKENFKSPYKEYLLDQAKTLKEMEVRSVQYLDRESDISAEPYFYYWCKAMSMALFKLATSGNTDYIEVLSISAKHFVEDRHKERVKDEKKPIGDA